MTDVDSAVEEVATSEESIPEPVKNDMVWQCPLCAQEFGRKDHCRRHILGVHFGLSGKQQKALKDNEKSYICEHCDTVWSAQWELNRHVRRVHQKRYVCSIPESILALGHPVCNQSYNRPTQLIWHIATRHNQLPKRIIGGMIGLVCGQEMSAEDGSCEPIGSEKAICPFDQCSRTFESRNGFMAHVKQHLEAPFECPNCQQLVQGRHTCSRRETKIECDSIDLYRCDICGAEAFSRKSLRQHIRAKHIDPTRFKCDHCDYTSPYRTTMKRHIKTQHRPQDTEPVFIAPRPPRMEQPIKQEPY